MRRWRFGGLSLDAPPGGSLGFIRRTWNRLFGLSQRIVEGSFIIGLINDARIDLIYLIRGVIVGIDIIRHAFAPINRLVGGGLALDRERLHARNTFAQQ